MKRKKNIWKHIIIYIFILIFIVVSYCLIILGHCLRLMYRTTVYGTEVKEITINKNMITFYYHRFKNNHLRRIYIVKGTPGDSSYRHSCENTIIDNNNLRIDIEHHEPAINRWLNSEHAIIYTYSNSLYYKLTPQDGIFDDLGDETIRLKRINLKLPNNIRNEINHLENDREYVCAVVELEDDNSELKGDSYIYYDVIEFSNYYNCINK